MKRGVRVGVTLVTLALMGWVCNALWWAREASREAICINNLKSIGLGLINYHEAFECFPAGTVANPGLPPERRLSWFVGAWGHVGDGQIRLNIDRSKAWDDLVNLKPTGYSGVDGPDPTSELFSPGCPGNPRTLPSGFSRVLQYGGVGGLGVDSPTLPAGHPRDGVFGYDRVTRLTDITDGAFTTMMVIETATRNGPWTAGGPTSVRGVDQASRPYIGKGRQFGGTHRDRVMVLFADGSVRARTGSMNPKLFELASTVAGNTARVDPDDSP